MENLFKEYEGVFDSETEEYSGVKVKKPRVFGYSPFALQDAVGEKNVKKAWIEYEKLRLAGIGADEIIYNIVSKIRDMTAITMGADVGTLGIKDYPFNKSKKDAKNWTEARLKNFYTKLIELYHRSRMGGDELDLAIEKTLLSI